MSGDPSERQIEETINLAVKRLENDGEAAGFADYARQFLNAMPAEDRRKHDAETLLGQALSMWRLAARREPGKPMIRIFNPALQAEGWHTPHTVVQILNDDRPFLLASVLNVIIGKGRQIHELVHPILSLYRDDKGQRCEANASGAQEISESHVYLEIDRETDEDDLVYLKEELEDVLASIRLAVDDWQEMLAELRGARTALGETPPDIDREELEEALEFLDWLADDNFLFLGYREFTFEGKADHLDAYTDPEEGLGLLRDPDFAVLRDEDGLGPVSPEVREFLTRQDPLIILKGNVRSPVHRRAFVDVIGVKQFDGNGALTGEKRFIGLFTSRAYHRRPQSIPLLRRKVQKVIEKSGFRERSHDARALLEVMQTYPRDELFQADVEEVGETALAILRLRERPAPRIFVRKDPYHRFVSMLVFLPREVYDTPLRHKVEAMVSNAYNGEIESEFTQVGDQPLARLHLILRTYDKEIPDVDLRDLNKSLADLARSWSDALGEELVDYFGEEDGNDLRLRYQGGFSAAYRESSSAEYAVRDIEKLEQLHEQGTTTFSIYRRLEDEGHALRLKIYRCGRQVILSECLPKLENLSLHVIEETAYPVYRDPDREGHQPSRRAPAEQPDNGARERLWIHDFYMEEPRETEFSLEELKDRAEQALHRIWAGELEDDSFNGLILQAGLPWRDVSIIRAYSRYLRQTNISYSQGYIRATVNRHGGISGLLVDLFKARLDPEHASETEAQRIIAEIEAALEQVPSLDEDTILRRFLNAILATLRTNYFQTGEDGDPHSYLSIKFDSTLLEGLPLPRPYREIFIYSPRFEGVHLRGGPVARGGIRWSDRPEDFRTEVLGLMKAQMVKNAVIVPVGAKGGFVPKQLPPGDRDAAQQEAIYCYRNFIRGLLDLTDNRVGDKVVAPKNTARHDDDDPYLVVAADKGTASFSDIANEIAGEYGFWLGDAFASGGSHGYDHKEMGITARGAWVNVRRHFREMGIDTQTDEIRVIGIGDMSGDVFGNGMLLSQTIKLVGAFDHRHIFIDPDPDPEASFRERERLFSEKRSTWEDYNPELISEGGGVFSRQKKSISLNAKMKEILETDRDRLSPNELIHLLLQAKADLLWFGGIGTYVKSSEESHAEVGDRANDSIRVNGRELRAKVIGEGGNLGLTQKGRIEYAQAGGRLNTDAVDNSGGVDCSDHEVNIKILLNRSVEDGDLTAKQRNNLLTAMTDDVADLVLADNYRQSGMISVTQARAAQLLEFQANFMRMMERDGSLNRKVEALPDDEEISERLASGKGLTRPETAVLMGYAKLGLAARLLRSDVPDDPWLEQTLKSYFPDRLHADFEAQLQSHRLRRDIIANELANAVINHAGITYVTRVAEETGAPVDAIVRAYLVAREVFDLPQLWDQINALDYQVDAGLQLDMMLGAKELLHRQATWFLTRIEQPLDLQDAIDRFCPGVRSLKEQLSECLPEAAKARVDDKADSLCASGVPKDLAYRAACMEYLAAASDIVMVGDRTNHELPATARAYFRLGDELGLSWMRSAADEVSVADHWERLATTAIRDEVFDVQRILALKALDTEDYPKKALEDFLDAHGDKVRRCGELISEIRASGSLSLAKLGYVLRQIRALFDI